MAGNYDPARWQMWWYFNRDRYLQLGRFLAGLNTSSGGGATSALPSQSQVENQIMPALERILRSGGKVEVMRGAMLSIAEIEAEYGPMGLGLDHYALHFLKNGAPENQESALVALGIRGDAKSVELLRGILLNDETGRAAMGGSVGVRNRAYAAYSMGLIGAKTKDEATRLRIVDTLLIAIGADYSTTRETQVACALSVGLVPLPFCGDDPERLARHVEEGDLHLCGGVQLNYLLDVFQDPELDVWLRSHTAPAMGRLAAQAPNEYKQTVSEAFFAVLEPRRKVEREVI
ncbi:MAG: hypothetical protein O7B99_04915, partial [Planctomycetota bacterium]|nr:hypothetical protein [Planctomycetota bacterium]